MIWSREADKDLLRLNNAGHGKSLIASWLAAHYHLWVTPEAVKGRLRRLQGTTNPSKDGSMDSDAVITRKIEQSKPRPRTRHCRKLAPWPKAGGELPFLAIGIEDLKSNHCRWPDDNMRFCGQEKYDCSPYCERHFRLAYRPVGRAGSGGVAA